MRSKTSCGKPGPLFAYHQTGGYRARYAHIIAVDIPNRRRHLNLTHAEIQARLAVWRRPASRFTKGCLALYARLAESADKGAIIRYNW